MGLKVSNSEILVTVLLSTLYEKGLSTSTGNLVKSVAISFFASCIKTNDPSPKPKKFQKLEIVFTKRPSFSYNRSGKRNRFPVEYISSSNAE